MTTTGVAWAGGYEFDRHLLRGQTTGRLDAFTYLLQDPGPDVLASGPRPADVTAVTFTPGINAAVAPVVTAHGIRVDTAIGEVEALAVPPVPAVHNFLLTVAVTVSGNPVPFEATVRVHIHRAIVRAWCSPALLGIHRGSDGQRLSVLAQFDDDTVGDITGHPGITWASAGPAVTVRATTGELAGTALTPAGAPVRITATLPADLGGGMAAGDVAVLPAWNAQTAATRAATAVPGGPGPSALADVPNVLFVAEGFEDRVAFEQMVQKLVNQLRTSPSASPFTLLRGSINYWSVFLPSRQAGQTSLHEMNLASGSGGLVGREIDPPERPAPGALKFTLPELIHEVGLPVPADGGPGVTFAAKRAEWTILYSVAAGRVDAALFASWKAMHNRRLASERDTALGLAVGQRPAAEARDGARVISFHRLRSTRAHLDTFLATVTNGPGGPVIGTTWTSAPAAGKDRDLVMALCSGANGAGTLTPDPADPQHAVLVASGLVSTLDVLVAAVPGSREVTVRPHRIPRAGSGDVLIVREALARCMHEICHAFGLDEEYGGNRTAPAAELPRLRAGLNVQALRDLDLVNTPPTTLLGDNVRWRWPRLHLAGRVAAAVFAEGGGFYRVRLAPGSGAAFAGLTPPDNIVHLRQPLTQLRTRISGPLEVVQVQGDEVRLRPGSGALTVADYPPGSVLCQPVPAPASAAGDTFAELLPQRIREHLNTTHGPLNTPPGTPCAPLQDSTQIQNPVSRPAGLRSRPPRVFLNWMVGLYDAGASYDCEVYHPTGICLMRQLRVPSYDPRQVTYTRTRNPGVIYRLCVVCQYVLVDRIDPRQHAALDTVIGYEYRQP